MVNDKQKINYSLGEAIKDYPCHGTNLPIPEPGMPSTENQQLYQIMADQQKFNQLHHIASTLLKRHPQESPLELSIEDEDCSMEINMW